MSRPEDHFDYLRSELAVDGLPLHKVAEKFGTPVYVYSAEAFLKPLRELQAGLRGLDSLICFATKSNSNLSILKMLAQAGAGMDLVSGGELYRAGRAGVRGDRIVFSGVGKTPEEMVEALSYGGKGIYSFNVESLGELEVLDAVARRMKRRARVALRFNPDVDAKTHPYISTGLKQNKFGIERKEVLAVARAISRLPGIDLRGISVHIGSQLTSLAPMGDAFTRTRALLKQLDAILPEPLSFVDLGGGVGITYDQENPPSTRQYTDLIQRHFGAGADLARPLKILIEPGRMLSGNAGALVTEALYRKERGRKDFLIVDAAMNDLLRPALYGSFHRIIPVRKTKGPLIATDVSGPVCETGDCFARDRKLAKAIAPGDLVAILSAGAYGFAMASNYNSRPRPPEVLVQKGRMRLIRKRETLADLVRGE